MEEGYKDDLDIGVLRGQLEVLQTILKENESLVCFDNIWQNVKELELLERALINQIVKVCQLQYFS